MLSFIIFKSFKMKSTSKLAIGDDKLQQLKEYMEMVSNPMVNNSSNVTVSTNGMSADDIKKRFYGTPYTKIFNDMMPFEEGVYSKKEFLEKFFKHAGDPTLLPFLKRISSSESYTRKEVKKEFKITVPANTTYTVIINPYNIQNAVTVYNTSVPITFVAGYSIVDRFQLYYSSHLFRLGYCVAQNLSKKESSTDNKLVIDAGLIGGNIPLDMMDNIIQNANSSVTHSILTYDAFTPICTTLYNSSNNTYYSADGSNPTEDTVSYYINTTGMQTLNSSDAINLPGDHFLIYNFSTVFPVLSLYSSVNGVPTLITAISVSPGTLTKFVPTASVVYAQISLVAGIEIKVGKKSARSQDLIYYRLYAPNSAAIFNISYRAVYDVAVAGSIRTEIGTFTHPDDNEEFSNVLLDGIYKGAELHNFPETEHISLDAGFFSDLISKWLNKIPYIGSYLAQGYNVLNNNMKLESSTKTLKACADCPSNESLQYIIHNSEKFEKIYMIVSDGRDSVQYPSYQILETLKNYSKNDKISHIYGLYKMRLTSIDTRVLFVANLYDEFALVDGPIYYDVDKSVVAIAIKVSYDRRFLKGNVMLGGSNTFFDGVFANVFRECSFPRIVGIFNDELRTLRRHKNKKLKNDEFVDIFYIDGFKRLVRRDQVSGFIAIPNEWNLLIPYSPAYYKTDSVEVSVVKPEFEESIILHAMSGSIKEAAKQVKNVEKIRILPQSEITKVNEPKTDVGPGKSSFGDTFDEPVIVNTNPAYQKVGMDNRKFRFQTMAFKNTNTYSTPYIAMHNKLRQMGIYIGMDNSQKKQRSLSQLTTPTFDDESFGVRYQFFPALGKNASEDTLVAIVLSNRPLENEYFTRTVNDTAYFVDQQFDGEGLETISSVAAEMINYGGSIEKACDGQPLYFSVYTKHTKGVLTISGVSYLPAVVAMMAGAPNGQILTGHIKPDLSFGTIPIDTLLRKVEILRNKGEIIGKMVLAVSWDEKIMEALNNVAPVTIGIALALDGPSSSAKILQISTIEHLILFSRLPMQSKGFNNFMLRQLGLLSPLQDDLDKVKVAISIMAKIVSKGMVKPDLNSVAAIFKAKHSDRNATITLPNNDSINIRVTSSYNADETDIARTNTNTNLSLDVTFGQKNAKYVISADKVNVLIQAYMIQCKDRGTPVDDRMLALSRVTLEVEDFWVTNGATFISVLDYFRSIDPKYFPDEEQHLVSDVTDRRDVLIKLSSPIDISSVDDYNKSIDTSNDVAFLCALFKRLIQALYPEQFGTGLRVLHSVNNTEYATGLSKAAKASASRILTMPPPGSDVDTQSQLYGYTVGAIKSTKKPSEALWNDVESYIEYMPQAIDNMQMNEKLLLSKIKGMSYSLAGKLLLMMKYLPNGWVESLTMDSAILGDIIPMLVPAWKTFYEKTNLASIPFSPIDPLLPLLTNENAYDVAVAFKSYLAKPFVDTASDYKEAILNFNSKIADVFMEKRNVRDVVLVSKPGLIKREIPSKVVAKKIETPDIVQTIKEKPVVEDYESDNNNPDEQDDYTMA